MLAGGGKLEVMSGQDEGLAGRMVGRMIRRSVRHAFRRVYWMPPAEPVQQPAILVANHHGWHDGYLMYHLVTRFGLRSLDWIAEFDAFPLFAKIGGLPYPPADPLRRAASVRRTIRLMHEERRSLVLFAEGELHRGPGLLPFGRSLEVVARKVEGVQVVPVAIRYDVSLHERPEAFILIGEPVQQGEGLCDRTRDAVASLLNLIDARLREGADDWQVLANGTLDVNERWDMRLIRSGTRKTMKLW